MNGRTSPFKLFYDQACPVCGGEAPGRRIGTTREHEYQNTVDIDFPVYQCPTCDLVYLYPRPDVSELGTIYPPDYYAYHLTALASATREQPALIQGLFHKVNTRRYRQRLGRWMGKRDQPIRILDIGCGVGNDLDILRSLFPTAQTVGIEMDEEAASKARARGHEVFVGPFESVELPPGSFDIVTSSHVIEHLARPDEMVRRSLELLRPGGVVQIETPSTEGLDFRMFAKGHWGGYHAPRHFYLFRFRTLDLLAERFGAKVVDRGNSSSSAFWTWTAHSIVRAHLGRTVADALFPPVSIYFGGLRALLTLSAWAALERVLGLMVGRTNSLWVLLSRTETASG